MSAVNASDRHPSVRQVTQWFGYEHLPEGLPREVSRMCAFLAAVIGDDSAELTTGLRKLLEAKDCLVRAAIAGEERR